MSAEREAIAGGCALTIYRARIQAGAGSSSVGKLRLWGGFSPGQCSCAARSRFLVLSLSRARSPSLPPCPNLQHTPLSATRTERRRIRVLALQGGQGGNTGCEQTVFPVPPSLHPPLTDEALSPTGYFALGVANHSVKLTETKLGASSSPKSWGIDSDTYQKERIAPRRSAAGASHGQACS